MSKKMLKRAKRQVSHTIRTLDENPNSINLLHSLSLGTLPYSYLGCESCLWQLFYRAETGILKNSVNASIDYRAERRLKRE